MPRGPLPASGRAGRTSISASRAHPAASGLTNMLRHAGVLAGEVQTRESLGKPPAIILEALELDDYLLAPESGLLETVVDPGDRVEAGQVVARLHFIERPDRPPA